MTRFLLVFSLICVFGFTLNAREITTNAVHMASAPEWVTRVRVEKIVDHIQRVLEWNIRRIEVFWYTDQSAFEKMHGLGPNLIAVARKQENAVRVGPRVTTANFDQTFGHELVHVISFQKYKEAIPQWLEEGLANHLAKAAKVDYNWLATKPFPSDVRGLVNPHSGTTEQAYYHYRASQALIEMIAAKCNLSTLLRLSVGENMDNYLATYCSISDLNQSFQKWVKSHATVKADMAH